MYIDFGFRACKSVLIMGGKTIIIQWRLWVILFVYGLQYYIYRNKNDVRVFHNIFIRLSERVSAD